MDRFALVHSITDSVFINIYTDYSKTDLHIQCMASYLAPVAPVLTVSIMRGRSWWKPRRLSNWPPIYNGRALLEQEDKRGRRWSILYCRNMACRYIKLTSRTRGTKRDGDTSSRWRGARDTFFWRLEALITYPVLNRSEIIDISDSYGFHETKRTFKKWTSKIYTRKLYA